MEPREYHRIFLEAFPDWDVCPACEQLYKKKWFKWCVYCDKNVCINCHKSHEIHRNCSDIRYPPGF